MSAFQAYFTLRSASTSLTSRGRISSYGDTPSGSGNRSVSTSKASVMTRQSNFAQLAALNASGVGCERLSKSSGTSAPPASLMKTPLSTSWKSLRSWKILLGVVTRSRYQALPELR